jgi:hypothetical protein
MMFVPQEVGMRHSLNGDHNGSGVMAPRVLDSVLVRGEGSGSHPRGWVGPCVSLHTVEHRESNPID